MIQNRTQTTSQTRPQTRYGYVKNLLILSVSVLLVIALLLHNRPASGGKVESPYPLPEFSGQPSDWLNSSALKKSDLKGKVVLLDFWTFGCWNCYRSFPWLNDLEKRYQSEDFIVIGIHTPEFEHEKVRANVESKIAEFKLKHPVMMDNDFTYWRSLNNRFWPAFYIIDKKGMVRGNFIGETHKGDGNALNIEKMIKMLLAEN